MEKVKTYFVYLIGDSIEPGYVGVTCNKPGRWKAHLYSSYPVSNYIRENNLSFSDELMKTLYQGTKEECFQLERQLRPYHNMGLNVAPGGHGGERIYTKERNKKISDALKGRTHSWGYKVSHTKRRLGTSAGKNNPRARLWKFTSPNGKSFVAKGNKQKFCDDNSILASCLVYYLGQTVPPFHNNGRGGFRAKNENSLQRRMNSVGWMLELIDQ
jgi:hypothetical protein